MLKGKSGARSVNAVNAALTSNLHWQVCMVAEQHHRNAYYERCHRTQVTVLPHDDKTLI